MPLAAALGRRRPSARAALPPTAPLSPMPPSSPVAPAAPRLRRRWPRPRLPARPRPGVLLASALASRACALAAPRAVAGFAAAAAASALAAPWGALFFGCPPRRARAGLAIGSPACPPSRATARRTPMHSLCCTVENRKGQTHRFFCPARRAQSWHGGGAAREDVFVGFASNSSVLGAARRRLEGLVNMGLEALSDHLVVLPEIISDEEARRIRWGAGGSGQDSSVGGPYKLPSRRPEQAT